MKRLGCVLLFLGLFACGEGCKRSSSEKKPMVEVSDESDFIYAGDLPSSSKALAVSEALVRMGRKGAENAALAKQNWNDAFAERDTRDLGKALVDFRKEPPPAGAGPADDNARSLDRFESYLRRIGKTEAYEKLLEKKMGVTFLYFANNPNHLIAWHMPLGEQSKTYATYTAGGTFSAMGIDIFERALHAQELMVVGRYAAEFGLTQYTSLPLQTIRQRLNTDTPARILVSLKQTQPQALKNPPDARTLPGLIRFLKDNVSREVAKPVDLKKIRVNLDANFYDDTDLLVCQAETKKKTVAGGTSEKEYKLVLLCDGRTMGEYDPLIIAKKFK